MKRYTSHYSLSVTHVKWYTSLYSLSVSQTMQYTSQYPLSVSKMKWYTNQYSLSHEWSDTWQWVLAPVSCPPPAALFLLLPLSPSLILSPLSTVLVLFLFCLFSLLQAFVSFFFSLFLYFVLIRYFCRKKKKRQNKKLNINYCREERCSGKNLQTDFQTNKDVQRQKGKTVHGPWWPRLRRRSYRGLKSRAGAWSGGKGREGFWGRGWVSKDQSPAEFTANDGGGLPSACAD